MISFDFPSDLDSIYILAQLRLNIDKDIHFVLKLDSERKNYTWEDIYGGIQVENPSDDIRKKIFRER